MLLSILLLVTYSHQSIIGQVMHKKNQRNIVNIFLSISLNMCLGAQKTRISETVLLRTNNICFCWDIRKIIPLYAPLSGRLLNFENCSAMGNNNFHMIEQFNITVIFLIKPTLNAFTAYHYLSTLLDKYILNNALIGLFLTFNTVCMLAHLM